MDGVTVALRPIGGRDQTKIFFRNLARDVPLQMDFVPRIDLMRLMIKKAKQI